MPIARWLVLPFAISMTAPLAAQTMRYAVNGSDVAVYNLAGELRVESGTGPGVVVEITRRGADAARLTVENGPLAGRQALRVIYPGDRIVYAPLGRHSRTQFRVRDDGTFNNNGGREVIVSGDGGGLEASADLRVLVPTGQQVAVYLAVGRVTVSNVNGRLMVDASSADVSATGTRGALSIDVGSGNVDLAGAEGEVKIDTGSGDVSLTGGKATRLGVESGSGNVTATSVDAAVLKIETGSGDVRLKGLSSADVDIDTGSGEITLDVTAALQNFRGETGSGNITIRAPGTLSAAIDLETSSGDISTDFTVAITRKEEDRLVGRIGSGAGRISVETGSGDVRLLRN